MSSNSNLLRSQRLRDSLRKYLKSTSINRPCDTECDWGMPLTFGIEIECYVALEGEVLSNPSTVATYEYLRERFAAAGLLSTFSEHPKAAHSYRRWMLTHDSSLKEVDDDDSDSESSPLESSLTQKFAELGIELVSRPMPVPKVYTSREPYEQPQLLEIKKFMKVLEGSNTSGTMHAAFVGDSCGMHIHIGQPGGAPLPLELLRHLAYMLVLYEPTLNKLHPHGRTPYPDTAADSFCSSNRTAFLTSAHTCYTFRECFVPLDEIRRRIFDPHRNIQGLAWLMGNHMRLCDQDHPQRETDTVCEWCTGQRPTPETCPHNTAADPIHKCEVCRIPDSSSRYHAVNWRKLLNPHEPNTIEFRQPAGTIDTENIGWTVQLYTALVREAERRAYLQQGEFSFHETQFPTDISQFLDKLHVSAAAKKYWLQRAADLAVEATAAGMGGEQLKADETCYECFHQWVKKGAEEEQRIADELLRSSEAQSSQAGDAVEIVE